VSSVSSVSEEGTEIISTHRRAVRALKRALRFRRDPRLDVLRRAPVDSVCAEIGVWKGDFSRKILRHTSPRKLHLIDPWSYQPEFPDRKYGGGFAKRQEDMDGIFESVQSRFAGSPNVSIHRASSDDAMAQFPDGYFDWIYLDGNHEFDFVLRDMTIGFSKVRSGGFIAGDDFGWGRKRGFPVRSALAQFVRSRALENQLEVLGSQFIVNRPSSVEGGWMARSGSPFPGRFQELHITPGGFDGSAEAIGGRRFPTL
jgi:hypothetical protein